MDQGHTKRGRFSWVELMTTDPGAARSCYSRLESSASERFILGLRSAL